jgi:type VI secretion system protein ImpA
MSSNRKHTSHKSATAGATANSSGKESTKGPTPHDWMAPVDATTPCGADLEYDPEFIVLSAKAAPRAEAQYGAFVGSPEPVNWSDVDRDCRRLMMRSKDMRLAVLFTRCRTRLAGAAGLAEGIGLLAAWLDTFAQALHPQPDDADADRDAALEIRMNALQALTDTEGLLSDVREIALTKSTAIRLQMRDIERAFTHPRPSDALAPESVTRQIQDLRNQQPAILTGFDEALAGLAGIETWSREHLGMYAPDLSVLTRLLRHVGERDVRMAEADPGIVADDEQADANGEAARDGADDSSLAARAEDSTPLLPVSSGRRAGTTPADRHAALELIREARQWFELHEPSSPIPVLLRRAEQFVGKRYSEAVRAIPAELLMQWDSEEPE